MVETVPSRIDSEGEVDYDEDEEGPLNRLYDPVESYENGDPKPSIREEGNGMVMS